MLNNGTRISTAEVVSTVDDNRNGVFWAIIHCEPKEPLPVKYVSPYNSNDGGAFVAVPEKSVEVLCCKPEGSDMWYYLGATFEPEPMNVDGDSIPDALTQPMERVDPMLYASRGIPMKQIFKSRSGDGIVMSYDYAPEGIIKEEGYLDRKVELNTNAKKITMSDSPAQDSIVLDSGNNARIMLTDDPEDENYAARSIRLESVGPQLIQSKESEIAAVVQQGGRELQLINNADGVEWGTGAVCGNVNVQSEYKDVNVFTRAQSGRIFIECIGQSGNNQQIIIETNGDSNDGITIKTNGSVNIDADSDINVRAGNEIKMSSSGKFSVDCDSFQVQANQVNIDPAGGTVELANGASPSTPNIPNPQSTYGNAGVTTY